MYSSETNSDIYQTNISQEFVSYIKQVYIAIYLRKRTYNVNISSKIFKTEDHENVLDPVPSS